MSLRALVSEKNAAGRIVSGVQTLDESQLPEGNVHVDIDWAGFNYKDGLCLTGAGGLVRQFPHIAGVDFVGRVRQSADPRYQIGQAVILTGWRVGETHWGGFAEQARVSGDWLVPLPDELSGRDAMIAGTAGLTAMLAIGRLEGAGLTPEQGEILVTGAGGGVGSIAVSLLARLGYSVTALSGRSELSETLKGLGATNILGREGFLAEPDKPLEKARWAGAIDAVGGAILAKLLGQVQYGGVVAAIGNAGGIELNTNVLPFILRGVTLMGIDSVMQPHSARVAAWARLAQLFDRRAYGEFVREIGLEDLPEAAEQILAGKIKGRLVVNPRAEP